MFPIIFTCLVLIFTQKVTISYNGFAIDSNNVLYLGKNSVIEKYSNGILVGQLDSKTSRGYAFTIQKNDTILISTASTVYTLDLDGNTIKEEPDKNTKIFNELNLKRNKFVTNDGAVYLMKSNYGRTTIIKNGIEEVFVMPIFDYAIKITYFLSFISSIIIIPIIIIKWRKQQ